MRHSTNTAKTLGIRTAKRNDWQVSALSGFLDFLFPPCCLVCKAHLDQKTPYPNLCFKCTPVIEEKNICKCCGSWDIKLISEIETCLLCLTNPFSARYLRSCTNYEDKAEQIIKTLKYKKKFLLAAVIGKVFAEHLDLFAKKDWDLVLALPSHKKALRSRGFSHMHLVLKEFCKITKLKNCFFSISNHSKRGYQSLSDFEDRYPHMEGAFFVKNEQVLEKRILLLDDVITTGASAQSATKALLNAGAKSVDILSFARSAKFSKNRLLKPNEI